MTVESLRTLEVAITRLAILDPDQCRDRNGIGFNGRDSAFGHSLANSIGNWSPAQAAAAAKLCQTYKSTQLSDLDLPTPEVAEKVVVEVRKAKDAELLAKASIDYGLQFGEWRTVRTSKGLSKVRSAAPTQAFWAAWRSSKEGVRAKGFAVGQHQGTWVVSQWETIRNDEPAPVAPTAERVLAPLSFPEGLRPWQRDICVPNIVASLRAYKATLDASGTGVGKTYNALAAFRELGATKVVAIVRRAAFPGWRAAAAALGMQDRVVITNYERVRRGNTGLGKFVTEGRDETFIWDSSINGLIFDEVHWCSGRDTLNSKLLIGARRAGIPTLAASATAADNPLKMKAIGFLLGEHNIRNYWDWAARQGCTRSKWHNGYEFDAESSANVKKMADLHARIFPTRGIRVRKEDLGEAFPKTLITAQLVEAHDNDTVKPYIAKVQESIAEDARKTEELYAAAERAAQDLTDAQLRQDPESELAELRDRWQAANKAAEDREKGKAILARLRDRQLAELRKVGAFAEQVEDTLAEGNNVAVFLNFDDSLNALSELMKDEPHRFIRGTKGRAEEQARVETIEKFQDGRIRLVLCNTDVGGESINLQGKSRLSLISPNDSARKMIQVFGRVHRDGGEFSVQRVVCLRGGVEERVYNNFKAKERMIAALNDGHKSIADFLTDDDVNMDDDENTDRL